MTKMTRSILSHVRVAATARRLATGALALALVGGLGLFGGEGGGERLLLLRGLHHGELGLLDALLV